MDDPGRWAAWRVKRVGDGLGRLALTVLAALGVLAAWAGLALHEFGWSWQVLLVLTSGAHYLMWTAPVALVLAAVNRRWLLAGLAVVATVLAAAVQLPPTIAQDAPDGPRLRVMQANLRLGLADAAPLVRIVREQRIDVLATEELTDAETSRLLAAGLGRALEYHYLRPLRQGGSGLGIWSRYPLSAQADLPHYWLGVVRAQLATPGGPVTFYAVHLTPPYPFDPVRWTAEMPRLRRELHDRTDGPVIGIDHVLVRDAVATSADTVALPNSDHRGLITGIALR